jgi:hypothetical protein
MMNAIVGGQVREVEGLVYVSRRSMPRFVGFVSFALRHRCTVDLQRAVLRTIMNGMLLKVM